MKMPMNMNINKLSRWLLLLSPLLFAFTIPMDDDNFNFYLSTERVFSPSDQAPDKYSVA